MATLLEARGATPEPYEDRTGAVGKNGEAGVLGAKIPLKPDTLVDKTVLVGCEMKTQVLSWKE